MEHWWEDSPDERYWCEVTDRIDVGENLKAPTLNDADAEYWGYSLIRLVHSGDIVFHYSTNTKAFVGVSVAGDPVEDRPIIWRAHGYFGASATTPASPRPGWWRPLYGFTEANEPLELSEPNNATEVGWITDWRNAKEGEGNGKAKIPFQLRRGGLRGGQGYLFKMPQEFVARWAKLETLAASVSSLHESLGERPTPTPDPGSVGPTGFRPKNEGDYEADIRGGKQRRTRGHEKLVRLVGEWFKKEGATMSTPHPVDLLMSHPSVVIFEAKTTHARTVLNAVREAVPSLPTYVRHGARKELE